MVTTHTKKLILSKESAQFILEGLRFFKENPQATDWHNLNKDTFLLLARDVAQFYPDEKEKLSEYFVRFESFLQRIINNEELAPSVPQNLEELVSAFEAFQQEKDATAKTKEVDIPTSQDITLEDWIKNLQEKHLRQRIEREVEKEAVFPGLPEERAVTIKRSLVSNIAAVIPRTVVPSPEEERLTKERVRHVLDQETIGSALKEKEPLAKRITERVRFLTVPPTAKPPPNPEEQSLTQAVSRAIKDKTPIKDPDQIQKTAQVIAQGLAQKTPKLTAQEKNALTEVEKITLTEEVVNASLPEIVEAIIEPTNMIGAGLRPEEAQELLQELTNQAKQPLLDLSVSLREELELVKTTSGYLKTRNNQEGAAFDQFSQNPLLPYQLVPQESQTPLGTQMRQVVNYHGIGPKSADIIGYQNEEMAGLTNSMTGKASPWWQNQINLFRARDESQTLIDRATRSFNLQIKFEESFPQLRGFYQRALSWSRPQRWFSQITSPITGFFKEKIGGWWKNTAIAKGIEKGAKSKAGLFLKKTLGSFSVFKAGAKKTLQEGAKKGVTKTIGWLAKKLAATKLGAALGSIAPGVGNAIGAIVGFGIDILKGSLNIFASTLQKITGGETEAEKTIKANLGPLGKIALSPITLIIIGTPILIFVLALGLFQIEGSALVVDDEEILSGLPFAQLPSENPIPDGHFAEQLVGILQECPATKPNGYINKANFNQVATCLKTAGISETVIGILENSVNRFASLQCVGFVQAVEASLGRTLPGCGNAKDYASCSAINNNSNYEYTNCQDLEVGAIGVSTGGTYGHVGIITGIETSETGITRVRFASAWGTSTQSGGRVTVTILPCDSFSALIQPQN